MLGYDVLCVGSATVDHFLTTETKLSKVKLGDKVLVHSMEVHTGGGATNACAALARMGLKVRMLTKLGCDHDADFILHELKKYKVKNIPIARSKKGTDFATMVASTKEKDRIIYVHKGASRDLCPSDLKKTKLRCKWVYLASLVGKSFKTAELIAKKAHDKKKKLLFNPSLYVARKGKKYLKKVLEVTDVLVLNKEEAEVLHGRKGSVKVLLRGLHELGPRTVIITDGPKRLYALNEDEIYYLDPPKVKVVHTAGAGDAFTAGFLAGTLHGKSFSEALKIGQVNANSVVQYIGTKHKLLTLTEAGRLKGRVKVVRL
jgi:ribokinase